MNTFSQLVAILLSVASMSFDTQGETQFLEIIMGSNIPWLSSNSSTDESVLTNEIDPLQLPTPDEAAKMARFIVHYSLWGSLSHISQQPQIAGSPLARVYSISDGPIRASSGVPYFYLTPKDQELIDMFKDPRASLTLTLAQTSYCRAKAYDPEDPRCAQVILTGSLVVLKNTTAEWQQAQEALFSRHPVMKNWSDTHQWLCCKLNIKRILVADSFGGNKFPTVQDYFKAQPDLCGHDNPLLDIAFY